MYASPHADGKLSLRNKEESYLGFYHHHKTTPTEPSPRRSSHEGELALSNMLLSGRNHSNKKEDRGNPEIMTHFKKLEELKLSTPRDLKLIKYEGVIKSPTVHNDYHTRATNHGYSRSETGGIFPK